MSVVSIAAALLLAGGLSAGTAGSDRAERLQVELVPSLSNPFAPRMGDRLAFRALIRNHGPTSIPGVIAWISLLEVDPGKEQPVDLEDWSAQKAVALAGLAPGQTADTEWQLRLIQPGSYRVSVIVAPTMEGVGTDVGPVASAFVAFTVVSKPVVETGRVLPIAFGVPLAIGGMLLWRGARGRRSPWLRKGVGR
jgi:hypothetical protein